MTTPKRLAFPLSSLILLLVYSAAHLPESLKTLAAQKSLAKAQGSSGNQAAGQSPAVTQPGNGSVFFDKDIQPIFEAFCYQCHTGEKPQGELRLDSRTAALTGGVSGKAFIPGNSKESLLVHRILGQKKETRMPPAGDPLSLEQINLIRAWIDQGAAWPQEVATSQENREASAPAPAASKTVDFVKDIQPILQGSCYACHSGGQPKGQLRLDSKELALKGGISGPVIVPGNSQDSRLILRVLGLGDEQRMPLKGAPLSSQQIALVRKWIDEGASWPETAALQDSEPGKHWAYVKPLRPQLPTVRNASWVRNPIDHFIGARLEKEKLSPSPEASKETLIRRVSLDLIGLPPTLQEVDDFLTDNSPGAYERVVDRLLASPHYGERWARPWLDLARYADTHGYEKDRRRSIWKYRDWVIEALNKDMPFDQFTIEQIAGDMLPDASNDQKIATGFHRNTMFNEEGGVDKEEAHWETLIDRVGTTATVWLGTTLACAQCHNHKYDPFTQKEFYQLLAFFSNSDFEVKNYGDTSQKFVEPILELPSPDQEAQRKTIAAKIATIENELKTQTLELDAAQSQWEQSVISAERDWTALEPIAYTSKNGSTLTRSADNSILGSGNNPERDVYIVEAKTHLKGVTAIRLEALPDSSLPRGGPGRDPYGNFLLSALEVEMTATGSPARAQMLEFRKTVVDNGTFASKKERYDSKGWVVDASREDPRLPRQVVFLVDQPFSTDAETLIKIVMRHESEFGKQGIGRFRLSVTTAGDPTTIVGIPAKLRPDLSVPVAKRTEAQRKELSEYYRSISPLLQTSRQRLADLRKSLDELDIVSTLVMREHASFERPSAHLRVRGSFLSKGEKVFAGVPAALHTLSASQLPNRLGLARWLVSEDNPLVARVTVNRFWEHYFGRGIVESSEDFGTKAEGSTHPELLDWLATEFMHQKWSMKAMHRLIVTSATYRQASRLNPVLRERDPYNRLLARGPRFRIEAEMVRDLALAVSGQLSLKIGGPSVFPSQPAGIWDLPYNDDQWTLSEGEDRYRRGLYTFARRTSPYPMFVTFDGPSREFCTIRRVRTNTPLQALTTLNDPAFFDAARSLARRMVMECSSDTRTRATYGFRLCLSRHPKTEEVKQIADWYERQLQVFQQDEAAAKRVVGGLDPPKSSTAAELAAWTMVANTLLNLDETLTKE